MQTMAVVVLLPGMDGTGSLFSEFIAALPRGLEPVVVTYPLDRSMNYAELEQFARASLPTEQPFVLVGESFSGPIAISLAASKPTGLRGLVLVCSFARSPIPMPSGLCSMISRFPVKLIPTRVTAALLLGRYASRALRERLYAAISKVDPVVWRVRLSAVLSADVAVHVSSIRVPVLYLRAAHDRVVPRRASELISKLLPSVKVVELEAPHFMLQAKPVESALQIQTFAREVGIAF
jgi:pimeloyl-[acyl-carrier protein] methyl ester esterase